MQSWKYCNYKENAIRKTNQAFLQRSLVESCRSAGSVCWPSKAPDTVKKRVRWVGPATVWLDSVMTSFVFWRNNTVLYCIQNLNHLTMEQKAIVWCFVKREYFLGRSVVLWHSVIHSVIKINATWWLLFDIWCFGTAFGAVFLCTIAWFM